MPPKRYQKLDPITHILVRSDMYVGSTRLRNSTDCIATRDENGYHISTAEFASSPAILRIFVEVLSNAIDNVERSRKTKTPCTKISVSINAETGETSVWNDGDIIPIEIDTDEKCYNHSMIFGEFRTGSNYDDEEERVVAGRNGLGAKLTNVFSTYFRVKGCDPINKKSLVQEWSNNLRDTKGPVVTPSKLAKGFTEVTWVPDFEKFEMTGYSDEIIALYTRYVLDAAMLAKVDMYLNNELIPIKSLQDYANLYSVPTEEKLYIKTSTAEVLLTPAKEYQTISFVNGVQTRLGGQHVDAWSEALFRPIVDKFNGKDKKTKNTSPKINITDVRQFFRLFVVATVVRPEFDGQDKNKLESPAVEAVVKRTHIAAILKWSVMDNIEDIIRAKEMIVLKKAEKVTKNTKINGYDRANKAGTKDGNKCSLFITEGLSAKTTAVAGIEEGVYGRKGRDWNGILPISGKLLNVQEKAAATIAGNKVICSIIHALGLKHGSDYNNDAVFNKLNYGRLIILADADVDGIHIEGLILNFIYSLYPSLMERSIPFVVSMKTPITRVKRPRGEDLLFYDERRFKTWLGEQTDKINPDDIKYYKGLGTTKPEDVPDMFGKKMVEFTNDENSYISMQKAFHKKHTDVRKQWLGEYDPDQHTFSLDDVDGIATMTITNFVNGELIKFSHADCARSIPSGIDGFKKGQRKILYAAKKRKLRYKGKSLKVAQLAGYVAEHSAYHHGEINLHTTMIGLAHEFPGTNNIPILYRDGQFGTRLEGGIEDAADGRYIFTKMDKLTSLIYRQEDEPLLTPVDDDGDLVEPEFYIPILPMILINGSLGIGTGWSSTIPCFNPLDMVEAIRIWLECDGEVIIEDPNDPSQTICMLPEYTPWYRAFKGDIEKSGENKYTTYGIIEEDARGNINVTELPIGMWTSKFSDFCEDLKADKKLKDVTNHSTTRDVHFTLTEGPDFTVDLTSLKLHSYLHTSNMVMFNERNQLRKYITVAEILDNFCRVRFEYYTRRKEYHIAAKEREIRLLGNKERFVQEVIDGDLNIMNEKEEDIIEDLHFRGYDEDNKDPVMKDKNTEDDGDEDEEEDIEDTENEDTTQQPVKTKKGGYNYLLRMQVRTFTVNKIKQIKNDILSEQKKLDALRIVEEKDMWLGELEEFEREYHIWLKEMEKQPVAKKKAIRKK